MKAQYQWQGEEMVLHFPTCGKNFRAGIMCYARLMWSIDSHTADYSSRLQSYFVDKLIRDYHKNPVVCCCGSQTSESS